MSIKISWSSEIPKIVRNFRDGMITLFAGLIPFQSTLAPWLNWSMEQFTTVCGIGVLVVGVIAKMFGVNDTVNIQTAAPKDDELNK